MKTNQISISDFSFRFVGYGTYSVTYQSHVTKKTWSTRTNDMRLIDATKNSENPKKIDLIKLKKACKYL